MNICFFDYDYSIMGGVEKVLSDLANGLCEKYNVFILSALAQNETPAFSISNKIQVKVLCKKEDRLRTMMMQSYRPMKEFLKQNKIDVCFLMGNYPVPIAAPIIPFSKTKFVFCDHGALINQMDNKKIVLFRKIASRLCIKTVTLTEKSMNDYIRLFKLKKNRVTYIYNWIGDDLLKKAENSEYDKASKKLISAGRFGAEKGFDLLIKACKPVFEAHPDWSLDLFGDGETADELKQEVKQNNLQKNINFMGMVNNLCDLYKNYSMYVLPSYREGLPLVLLEAKANKLPIISFDIDTGPAEIITDNVDGFLIKPYDTDAMADKICFLIEHPEKRAECSANYTTRLDLFNQKKILGQWTDLINSISGQGRTE